MYTYSCIYIYIYIYTYICIQYSSLRQLRISENCTTRALYETLPGHLPLLRFLTAGSPKLLRNSLSFADFGCFDHGSAGLEVRKPMFHKLQAPASKI